MIPSRFGPPQSSTMRKSRVEGRPSFLPKPCRPGSVDRLSTEARRPSAVGHRSSSADPQRVTFGAVRLSREASATKLPQNGRSRSQQGDKFAQSFATPLRNNNYAARSTTTPVRTPSEERGNRKWQTSLERALAFVTIRDQRPITNPSWQRSEVARVQEALASRSDVPTGLALMKPLTIARFVDITSALLSAFKWDFKLNTDNYITKLPHVAKRLLYPGAVSKSWLKTVNTLHAFPHALAWLTFLLDLVNHVEMPVFGETIYLEKDELNLLRWDHIMKCWLRFQQPDFTYEDLDKEYLQNLNDFLGNNDDKVAELQQLIQKYKSYLEDPEELAAQADEARRAERRNKLLSAVRSLKDAIRQTQDECERQVTARSEQAEAMRQVDAEVERDNAQNQQLSEELENQQMSVSARNKLMDETDYARRVFDSKRELAQKINKMLLTKETEVALWQKRSLSACVEYKQALIRLSAVLPELSALSIDEKELMQAACGARVTHAVSTLRECSLALAERRALHARSKTALARKRAALMEESRLAIQSLSVSIGQEQQALADISSLQASEGAAWGQEGAQLAAKTASLAGSQLKAKEQHVELMKWTEAEETERAKLSKLREYISHQHCESERLLRAALEKRLKLVQAHIAEWNNKLAK